MRYSTIAALAVSVAVTLACVLSLDAAEAPSGSTALVGLVDKLKAQNVVERSAATLALNEARADAVSKMVKILQAAEGQKTGEEGDPVAMVAGVLGEWRATEATRTLIKMVDYQLKLPVGAKRVAGAEFPCAFALTRIGGKELLGAVADAIAQETSIKRRYLLTWVVAECLGGELAKVHLEAVANKLEGEQRNRVRAAIGDLAKGNLLISAALDETDKK